MVGAGKGESFAITVIFILGINAGELLFFLLKILVFIYMKFGFFSFPRKKQRESDARNSFAIAIFIDLTSYILRLTK